MNKIIKLIVSTIITLISINAAFSITAELIQTNPAPVLAGEYADVTVRILEKSDSEFNNVYITPKETNFILLPEKQEEYITQVSNDFSVTRTFKIFITENTPEGNIEFPLQIKSDKLTTESKIEIFVQNSINNPDVRIVDGETIPKELIQNTQDNKAILRFQNLGEKEAKLIRAKIEFEENSGIVEAYPNSLSDTISILNSNEIGELEFEFDINKNVIDNSKYKLSVEYLTKNAIGNEFEKIEFIHQGEFKLSKAPIIEIEKIEYLDSFEINSKNNRVKLTLKNVGEADAENVKLKVAPDVSYPFEFDKLSQFIGYSIPMGETATAIIELNILKDANEKEYSNRLIIDSLIGDSRYSQDYNLKIPVNQSSTIFTPLVIGIIIIILAISISVSIGLKKRKNK